MLHTVHCCSWHTPASSKYCIRSGGCQSQGVCPNRHDLVHVQVKGDLAKLQLTSPVCTKEGEKIALSRRVEKHWRLIGWGQIQKGLSISMPGRQ